MAIETAFDKKIKIIYNLSNLSFLYNYNKKQVKQGEKLVISQELREVMDKIERLEPQWKLIPGFVFSAEQERDDPRFGVCFEKQTTDGIIHCSIMVRPTGCSWQDIYGDGHEGDKIFSHEAIIMIDIAQQSQINNFITVFNEWYGGAKYVIVVKRSFLKGYIKGGELRLIQKPSEEYQFLRKYVEIVDAALYKIEINKRLKAEEERQQQEQDCKKIFFGK